MTSGGQPDANDWGQYSRLVLAELSKADTRLEKIEQNVVTLRVEVGKLIEADKRQQELEKKIHDLEIELSMLKIKAGLLSMLMGCAATSMTLLVKWAVA